MAVAVYCLHAADSLYLKPLLYGLVSEAGSEQAGVGGYEGLCGQPHKLVVVGSEVSIVGWLAVGYFAVETVSSL